MSFDFEFVVWMLQVPDEETPAQVRIEEIPDAPKFVEESIDDSPDDAELPGEILERQTSIGSLPSWGDSSEHEGPDSSKMIISFILFYFDNLINWISFLAVSSPVPKEENPLEQQQPIEPLQTSRSDSSLNGTYGNFFGILESSFSSFYKRTRW